MNNILTGILIGLIPALAVSVATSLLTVRLSLKQFYSQRWWEKKAEAYSNIIEQLSYLLFCNREWQREYSEGINFTENYKKRLQEKYLPAKESISKAAATGAYIIADTAANALSKCIATLDIWEPSDEDTERDIKAVEECMAIVRECAKTDLQR